jgi:membrane associated rhomboid family serine protease
VQREPIFNIPAVIVALLALMALIYIVQTYVLSSEQSIEFLLSFAFIPARYDSSLVLGGALPGGGGAEVWSFLTYSLIHADWMHYGVNAIWFLPFGSAMARRFGAYRFLAFYAVCAVAGALAHLVTHAGEDAPMIGASAAISGTMAGAMRFAFQRGGPLSFWRSGGHGDYLVPAIPLSGVLREPAVLAFLAVWFGINLLFGVSTLPIPGMAANQEVAWQAHIGGFLAGLVLFSWFDPAPDFPQSDEIDATHH